MEIRARIALEVSKFQANAKVISAQFKAMGTSAQRYQDNVDHFAKRSLDRTKSINAERVKDTSKIGDSILAQEKKIADDLYSTRMEAFKRFSKDKSKLEQEAVRAGSSGVVTGDVRGPAQVNPLYAKEAKAVNVLTAKMRKEYEAAYAAKEKASKKAEGIARRESAKTAKELSSQNSKASRALQKHYSSAEKAIIKAAKVAEKEGKKLALEEYFKSDEFDRKLASTRYALYDLGRRAAMFGLAIGSAFALAAKSAIDFESAFTAVERTTQLTLNSNLPEVREEAENLRKTLIRLTTEIPVAFADITNIATIGAQMGIAAQDVDEFTETVARFSAITAIGAEDVALSFGRIAQLTNVPVQEFEKLSSAIAFTGINSVATDREILKMAEAIGAASTNAGIAAEDTIGFASALASLKVRPEEARGVLTRLFREFDLSVSRGGSKLDDLARVIGTTSEDAAQLWAQDPAQFVQSMLKGAAATGELNKVITALGITNSRELNVITRLANNMGVLELALSDSREQFELGTFSAEAYGLVTDDVASKIATLQNAIAALGASFGDILLPVLGPIIDGLKDIVKGLTNAPVPVKVLIGVVTALVAGFALVSAAIAGGIAGLLALRLAFQNLTGPSVQAGLSIGTLVQLIKSLVPSSLSGAGAVGFLKGGLDRLALSFKTASTAAKVFQVSLGFLGIASVIAGTIAAFTLSANESAKASRDLADANFEAAGGLDAFKKAADDGLESGATIYREVTAEMSKLTDEQKEQRQQTLEEAVARASLTKGTEDGAAAYNLAQKKLQDFNDEIARGNGLIETSTLKFTENTKEVIANALAKIDTGGDEPLNIFAEIARFNPEGLSPAARKSLEASGIDAAEVLNGAIESALRGKVSAVEYIEEQFANADFQLGVRNSRDLAEFAASILTAAQATDGLILSAEDANEVAQVLSRVLGGTAGDADDLEGEFADLNVALRETVGLLTSGDIAEGRVASALDAFAQGAAETAGEMEGLGEAARTNLTNFASFMNAAVEASIEAGEGTAGAVSRIIAGLSALEEQGINTGQAFNVAKGFIVDALVATNPLLAEMYDMLSQAQSLAGIESAIRAFYALKLAAADTPDQVREIRKQLDAAIASLTGFGTGFQVNLRKADKSTQRTMTNLQKLQETLGKLFSWTEKRMNLQDSINSLGDSLEKNGNTFSIWSKEGRSNVSSLLDVMDNIAIMANGDMQLFANQLGAMRQALVQVGAPASALKLVDDALKKTGKTAKVSKKEVDNFYRELADSRDAERSLAKIAAAVSEIQSTLKAGISAYFAQQNAIDDVTLGWLDMADAADSARDAIEKAEDSIDDARRTIDEANASIQGLAAQTNKLEYQLQIAIKYGDTLRADEIRAELAAINASVAKEEDNITDANRAIAKAQDEMAEARGRLGIEPTTRQIIEQNRALQDMAGRYADAAAWMLATAEEGADLNAIIESQVDDFYNNALQMGYSETQAKELADVMRTELLASMKAIPKDITTDINAETSAALSKVTKFANDANARLATIRDKTVTVTTRYVNLITPSAPAGGSGGSLVRAATGGLIRGAGTGTSDSITAQVSNGEYVVKAAAVSRYGVDFFNAINQMQIPQRGFQVGAAASAGSQTVYLSPEDRQLLRQAIDRPVNLYTDNATIAQSANDGNRILAQRGIR